MMALQGLNISSRLINGKEMGRYPRENSFILWCNHDKCKDDKWLCLGMLQGDKVWKDFCKAMGLDHMGEDPRFAEMAAREEFPGNDQILDETFIKKPREEWMKILHDGGDFIFTVVNSIGDLENDPQVTANNYIVDYDHPIHGMMKLLGMTIGFSETPGNPKGAGARARRAHRDRPDGIVGLQLGGCRPPARRRRDSKSRLPRDLSRSLFLPLPIDGTSIGRGTHSSLLLKRAAPL